MELHELEYTKRSKKDKHRKGRGVSAGKGKTAGRGENGQKSRSGGNIRPGFEGGQNPLYRRIPKFGFTNRNQKKYAIINLDTILNFNLEKITPEILRDLKIVKGNYDGIKILGKGNIDKKIDVKIHKISKSAKEIIENAGGKVEIIIKK